MALPANKIKKIKLPNSTEAYEIIPERLQNNGFEASLPTLSTNSTIALKSDVDNSVKKSGDSMSGNLNPATNKGASLGTSSLFWNNIYGTTLYENGTSLTDKYAAKSHTHTKAQVGLGSVENKACDTSVTNGSDNYITSGAVYSYVSNNLASYLKNTGTQVISGDDAALYLKVSSEGDSTEGVIFTATGSIVTKNPDGSSDVYYLPGMSSSGMANYELALKYDIPVAYTKEEVTTILNSND